MADTQAWWYERLPTIANTDEPNEWLTAEFSANNGLRITIVNQDDPDSEKILCCFNFNADQAETVGQALVRWAQRRRAEHQLLRSDVSSREKDDG